MLVYLDCLGFFLLWAGINLHTYTQANETNTLYRATCANIRLFAFHYSKFYIWDSILAEINNCWTNIFCFFLRNVMCDIECALKIQISGLADIIASNCFVLCLGYFSLQYHLHFTVCSIRIQLPNIDNSIGSDPSSFQSNK